MQRKCSHTTAVVTFVLTVSLFDLSCIAKQIAMMNVLVALFLPLPLSLLSLSISAEKLHDQNSGAWKI